MPTRAEGRSGSNRGTSWYISTCAVRHMAISSISASERPRQKRNFFGGVIWFTLVASLTGTRSHRLGGSPS